MAMLGPQSARPPGCQQHHHHHGPGSTQSVHTFSGIVNLPPIRVLERALEEAAVSGILILSCRKLKEFPPSAANHDLTDTVEADLSKNRLADVPSEVCHLVALESLNLYHNCIRTIPDSIINLQSLTSLDLSRNQLGSLPACLCGLPLRILKASNNKLESLPEAIGQLHSLMELDISCNEITVLPHHISRLKALQELNVRRNLLSVLPEDLADLPLVKFDFSCNNVSTIPVSYRNMRALQTLQLENNPLQSPPAQICIMGKVHIFKYLSVEACRNEKNPESLYLPVMEQLKQSLSTSGSFEDVNHLKKHYSYLRHSRDIGDKRLNAFEPSNKDSQSLNILSHIMQESSVKDESSEHKCSLKADRKTEERPMESKGDQFSYRESPLSTQYISYIQERTAMELDESLRYKKGTGIHINMINQLKKAMELLQDPSSGQDCVDDISIPKGDRAPVIGPSCISSQLFSQRPHTVFLRSHMSLESVNSQFSRRKKMEQLREELELMDQLRDSIESRLKVVLPEDLGASLMDGVVLCHLANCIRPCSVASIHIPSPAVPKLGMAKCRRNVENFLGACRKIGVPESSLCTPYDIIQCRLQPIHSTVQVLVTLDKTSVDRKKQDKAIPAPIPRSSRGPASPLLVSVTTQTPPAWPLWDLIGSLLLHIVCLVLLFVVYSWAEET